MKMSVARFESSRPAPKDTSEEEDAETLLEKEEDVWWESLTEAGRAYLLRLHSARPMAESQRRYQPDVRVLRGGVSQPDYGELYALHERTVARKAQEADLKSSKENPDYDYDSNDKS
jgi:hypothetical protein